jgi:hypothetical protein
MSDAAYGPWPLVSLNTAPFAVSGFSLFQPRSQRDWRVMGGYSAFLLALFTETYGIPLTGFLLNWPTIPTLLMFPVLIYMYVRLARAELHDVVATFGQEWATYAGRPPAFVRSLRSQPTIPAVRP